MTSSAPDHADPEGTESKPPSAPTPQDREPTGPTGSKKALSSLLGWRGADGGGSTLGVWLAIAAASWVLALLYAPLEPALILLPPILSLSVLFPSVQALVKSDRLAHVREVVRRFEMPLVMLAFGAVGQGVFGQMRRHGMVIDSGDNQYMMGRAELIYEGLRHGHWLHWTHLWQGGDTLTDLYPVEVNLLTAAVHALAPRGTTFVESYTTFVLLAWWLRAIGVYYLARRFSSPWVAFILAYASLFDVGSDVNGGVWFAAIYFGMIHNTLALTFGLFATALKVDLIRKISGKRLIACALMVAATACGHALGMLVEVVTTFALLLTVVFGHGPKRGAIWALGASGLGLALGAVWILPFSHGLKTLGYRVANGGAHYAELGRGMTEGSLPTSSFAAYLGLALVATLIAALSDEIAVAFSGFASLILILLVLTPLLVSARILDHFPAFLDAQPHRMLTAFKTTVIPCLAWILDGMFGRIPSPSGSLRLREVARRTLLLGMLVYGPLRSAIGEMDHLGVELRRQIPHKDDSMERTHTGADYRKIFAWLKERRQADPDPVPWRVAVLWRQIWRHGTWSEGMNTGVPITDPNQVPSNFFNIRPRENSAQGMNDWNIKYVSTDYVGAPFPGTTEKFSAGRFHIWEVDPFDDRYVLAPPGVTVTNVALEGESIRFTVAGAPPGGVDLHLRTAFYSRWRARQNGEWLPVHPTPPRPDARPKQDQLLIHAGNGDVVLTCDGDIPKFWLGLFVTICAGAVIPLLGFASWRERAERLVARARQVAEGWVDAWRKQSPQRTRAMGFAAAGLLLLGGVLARSRGAHRLAPAAIEGLSPLSVGFHSSDGAKAACLPLPWAGQYVCGADAAVVDSWLGTKGPGDDSGEAPEHWPGLRVMIREQGGTVTLGFGTMHLDAARGFWLQTTGGTHHVRIRWGDEVLTDSDLGGEDVHHFDVPSGTSGSKPLRMEIQSPSQGGYFVLRGGAGFGPR